MKQQTIMNRTAMARIGMLAMLLCIVGCGSGSTTSDGTNSTTGNDDARRAVLASNAGLVPQSKPPVPDIPVPVGFKIAESISRDYQSAGARYIDHTYEGHADKLEVDRFYATQMPLKNWVLRGRQMVRGEYVMRFEKGSEFAEVRITGDSNFTGTHTSINVNVQTLGRGDNKAYQNN